MCLDYRSRRQLPSSKFQGLIELSIKRGLYARRGFRKGEAGPARSENSRATLRFAHAKSERLRARGNSFRRCHSCLRNAGRRCAHLQNAFHRPAIEQHLSAQSGESGGRALQCRAERLHAILFYQPHQPRTPLPPSPAMGGPALFIGAQSLYTQYFSTTGISQFFWWNRGFFTPNSAGAKVLLGPKGLPADVAFGAEIWP